MQDQMNGKSLPATELHNPRPLVSEKPKSQYATPAHNTRPFSQQPSGLQTPIRNAITQILFFWNENSLKLVNYHEKDQTMLLHRRREILFHDQRHKWESLHIRSLRILSTLICLSSQQN